MFSVINNLLWREKDSSLEGEGKNGFTEIYYINRQ